MIATMETSRTIDVTSLDATHRRALEDVIGVQLRADQQVTIGVSDRADGPKKEVTPAYTLKEWASVYDGLTEEEIAEIDRIANTRANLTRDIS
jgi:hypothetical protein